MASMIDPIRNLELAKAMVSPIRCGGLDYPIKESKSFLELHAEFPISKKFSDQGALLTYAPFGISQIFFPDLNLTFTSSNGILRPFCFLRSSRRALNLCFSLTNSAISFMRLGV